MYHSGEIETTSADIKTGNSLAWPAVIYISSLEFFRNTRISSEQIVFDMTGQRNRLDEYRKCALNFVFGAE